MTLSGYTETKRVQLDPPLPERMAESSQLVDALAPDTRVWFPDKEKGWKAGHVTGKRVDGDNVQIDFVDENGKVSPGLLQQQKWGGPPSPENQV